MITFFAIAAFYLVVALVITKVGVWDFRRDNKEPDWGAIAMTAAWWPFVALVVVVYGTGLFVRWVLDPGHRKAKRTRAQIVALREEAAKLTSLPGVHKEPIMSDLLKSYQTQIAELEATLPRKVSR
jgi:hypothetical protein